MTNIENKIKIQCGKFSPFTNTVGISRSILALGLMLTLLFNSNQTLLLQKIDGDYVNPLLKSQINNYNFFSILGLENSYIMQYVAVIILLVVISGYYYKITSLLHWWISFSFLYFSSIIDGGDQINAILTLLLIPVLIFDTRKNHWNRAKYQEGLKNIIPIITIWIIRIQVAFIYFHASVGKYFVTEWINGTSLYYWWNNTVFGMPLPLSLFVNKILSDSTTITLITYSVLIFEILLFLALTAKISYRKFLLPLGVLFHLSIIIFHGIFSFFFSITAGLILFLYPTYENFEITLWKNQFLKK